MRRAGDQALLATARKFDGLDEPIEVTPDEIWRAAATVPRSVRTAIHEAARNIRTVAKRAGAEGLADARGARRHGGVSGCVPLDRVGCYVPGGRYPLPSSL